MTNAERKMLEDAASDLLTALWSGETARMFDLINMAIGKIDYVLQNEGEAK